MTRHTYLVLAGVLILATPAPAQVSPERQADVAERGRGVMPFDLDRSTHRFESDEEGGVQTVVSDDGDAAEVALIRAHLRTEAAAFARGDFSSPARIHGAAMPGLDVLRRAGGDLSVAYADVPGGGRVSYRSRRPEVVAALHRWFEAQTADHGAHAHQEGH